MFPRCAFPGVHFAACHWPYPGRLEAAALRFWLSGAGSDGGSQVDPDAALGNYRSSTEVAPLGFRVVEGVYGLRVVMASGRNAVGPVGGYSADGAGKVAFVAPEATATGSAYAAAQGTAMTAFDATDRNQWLRLLRVTAAAPVGSGTLRFGPAFRQLVGMGDTFDASAVSATNRYRALFLAVAGYAAALNVVAWLDPLGDQVVTSAAQLGASGAGTIGGATDCFIGWPKTGCCQVRRTNDALRETVWYSSRTDSVLTVPSTGRAMLGTSASAGDPAETVVPVPPYALAWEAAGSTSGPVQTIASESTAPTGRTWVAGYEEDNGLAIGAIGAGGGHGALWLWRQIPPDCTAGHRFPVRIELAFTVAGVRCRQTLHGLFRVGRSDQDRYLFHAATLPAALDLDAAPTATFASLPNTPAATFGNGKHRLVLNRRNAWGLRSRSLVPRRLTIVGGVEVDEPPSAPEISDLVAVYDGGTFAVQVTAIYWHLQDGAVPADTWQVWYKVGSAPVPGVDTITGTATVDNGGEFARLVFRDGAFTAGQTVYCVVRMLRSSDSQTSDASDAVSVAIAGSAPAAPTGSAWHGNLTELGGES